MKLIKSPLFLQTAESSLPIVLVALSDLGRSRTDWIGRLASVIPPGSLKFTILTCIAYNALSLITRPKKDPITDAYPEDGWFTPNVCDVNNSDNSTADKCGAEHLIMLVCSSIAVSYISPHLNLGGMSNPRADSGYLFTCTLVIGACSAFFGNMNSEKVGIPTENRKQSPQNNPSKRQALTNNIAQGAGSGDDEHIEQGPSILLDSSSDEPSEDEKQQKVTRGPQEPVELKRSKNPGKNKANLDGPPSPAASPENPYARFDSPFGERKESKSDDEYEDLAAKLDKGSRGSNSSSSLARKSPTQLPRTQPQKPPALSCSDSMILYPAASSTLNLPTLNLASAIPASMAATPLKTPISNSESDMKRPGDSKVEATRPHSPSSTNAAQSPVAPTPASSPIDSETQTAGTASKMNTGSSSRRAKKKKNKNKTDASSTT